MNKVFNYRALPIFLLVLITAILTATFLHYAFAIVLVTIAALLVVVCFCTKKFRKYTSKAITIVVAVIIALVAVSISFGVAEDATVDEIDNTIISGRVSGVSNYDHNGVIVEKYFYIDQATVDTADGSMRKVGGYIKVYYDGDNTIRLGDRVTLVADIVPISADMTNQEYVSYYRERVYNIAYANQITGIASGAVPLFDSIKLNVKKLYENNSLGNVGGFMYAMMFGDSSGMNPVMKAESGAIGVAHLFAVSGLHVAMIALVLVFFMNKLRLKAWLQTLITIIVLIVYNVLCGFTPSVLRASIMIIVGHIARIIGYRNDSISTLSFAGITVLALSPFSLFDISFYMSFTAVLAIVLFNKPIKNKLVFLPNYLSSLIAMSLSVNIGLLPIMIMCFGNLSLIFTIANMLIIPIITVAYPLMFITSIIGLIMPFAGVIIYPVSVLFAAVNGIITLIAKLPFAAVDFNISIAVLVAYIPIMIMLSRYIFIPRAIKRCVSTLLVLVFAGGVIVTSIGVINPNHDIKAMYSDSYSNEAYYHIHSSGKDYLLLNGDITLAAFDRVEQQTEKELIKQYDGLILDSVDNESIDIVNKYYKKLNIKNVYMRELNNYLSDEVKDAYLQELVTDKLSVTFGDVGEIRVEIDGAKMLFYNSYQPYSISVDKYLVVLPVYDRTVYSLNFNYIVTRNSTYPTNAGIIGFTFRLNSGKLIL